MSKFPEKLFCTVTPTPDPDADPTIWAYEDVKAAAEGEHPVRVGIYTLTEVVEVREVTTVDTVKVEN